MAAAGTRGGAISFGVRMKVEKARVAMGEIVAELSQVLEASKMCLHDRPPKTIKDVF